MTVFCIAATSCITQKVAYKERLEEAKGYALCACVALMNKSVDSVSIINKDYSSEYFVQLSHLSLDEIIKIKEYVKKNIWIIEVNPKPGGRFFLLSCYTTW